jgi:hypothetical protein
MSLTILPSRMVTFATALLHVLALEWAVVDDLPYLACSHRHRRIQVLGKAPLAAWLSTLALPVVP